ncbi:MAG TPA: T9SS type A sorting domain-containing protein [Bacteroidota bacterium]|nr:T9SS type A sorting domain-containing protein [Bacteroidota bacterium]
MDTAGIPQPSGIYVLNENSNEQPAATSYASGLTASPAYSNDIAGHAVFVPIAKILPSITTWGQFNWDWSFLDSLVEVATSNGKKFSIALETEYQASTSYVHSLPQGFTALAGANSAPLFDVWTVGGKTPRGISAYILLPWVANVQEFWSAAATGLAAHLKQTGAYGSLTLIHVPGLSVYDEELRLPSGYPRPTSADTLPCPDGRPAYPACIDDADTSRWRSLGYSDSSVIYGFKTIASAFAQAFPDRYLGLSLLNHGTVGIDFPNLTGDSAGYVAARIVKEVNSVAPGRVQVQSDDLDGNYYLAEVDNYAAQNSDPVGWQSNKHAGTGAGCDGGGVGSCGQDGPASLYFALIRNGAQHGGKYLEVWSEDVVSFPQSFDAAVAAGYFTVTGLQLASPPVPGAYVLEQNFPNPFNPSTIIRYSLPVRSKTQLAVYNMLGQLVSTLVNGEEEAGEHSVTFDASNVASGVYFYRLQSGSFVKSLKLLVLR